MSAVPRETEAEHLPTHVAVCAVRYAGMNARLRRIERVMWGAIVGVIGGMGTIIVMLLNVAADLSSK